MARINSYAVKALKVNDKLLASDGDTGETKNVSPFDVAELNAGVSIYRAFMDQSSTNNPMVTVVGPNTIGDIVWTREAEGIYKGYLSASFDGYVSVIPGAPVATGKTFTANTSNNDYVLLYTYDEGTLADSSLYKQYIEIRVYES